MRIHDFVEDTARLLGRGTGVAIFLITCASAGFGQGTDGDEPPLSRITDYESFRRERVYTATRTSERIVIDGVLDEAAWQQAELGGDFYQLEPRTGFPASEETEFRLLYDDENLYVGVVCHQERPLIINELTEDFAPGAGDVISLMFDTFDDDRNGFVFQTNPGGAKRDQQVTGSNRNQDWDGVYEVATDVRAPGWTSEFAIPLKTLRFSDANPEQRWGFNVMRTYRSRNERSLWSPGPRPFNIFNVFIAGTLEGLEGIQQGRNLYVKPFLVGNYRPDVTTGFLNKQDVDAGLDVKYGVTSELTLDLTVNTDFSQVEADEQQINLTRFSLFFPEKREFFLENAGLFDIGSSAGGFGGGGGRGGRGGRAPRGRDIIPFFSRRIGLGPDSQPLPIRVGARLTGKLAGWNVGFLNIQVGSQGEVAADNWTVVRLRREVLSNSDVGTFLFNRDSSAPGDWNRSGGLDANFRFLNQRLSFSGFAMKSQTPGSDDRNLAGRFEGSYRDPFYTFRASYLTIEEDFQNDLGFVPRPAIRKSQVFGRPTPPPLGLHTGGVSVLRKQLRYGPDESAAHANPPGRIQRHDPGRRFDSAQSERDVRTAGRGVRDSSRHRPASG